ncbi:hypothetical protein MtrunA17_Chr8g0380891 [Medicago truncatula]|uniref:Uncharacterized protein n=1 Tax=Medicago truncatula TaxID=3880 RepID=A0A396GRK6_MEDTR|nr:hypothetical protein MtrunA17_Chr8g0380891 [Medicago truncatula]
MATTLKKKIDGLIADEKEHVTLALKKAVTELYMYAQKKVAALYVEAEEESVESSNIVEPGNDVSNIYSKFLWTPKPISGSDPASSLVINLGEYKWTFIVRRTGTSLQFQLFADGDNNPRCI